MDREEILRSLMTMQFFDDRQVLDVALILLLADKIGIDVMPLIKDKFGK